MYFHRASCAIILCLAVEALGALSSTERSANKLEADDAISSKPDPMEDNVADSSVTSYSSIVIHHTPGKSKSSDAPEDQEKQASRSESYFKISNAGWEVELDSEQRRKIPQEAIVQHIFLGILIQRIFSTVPSIDVAFEIRRTKKPS
ncbi:hypothetical protein GE061_012909 [Apolygus lucorum]|uniref:Uncharacterized protein n=1 Tax=Apolygus lucorum TaxID=248454 RepID=A0A8S9XTY2_APOLU|nr:hypothetical protein GE061_012909 [Apolygus lucorum]